MSQTDDELDPYSLSNVFLSRTWGEPGNASGRAALSKELLFDVSQAVHPVYQPESAQLGCGRGNHSSGATTHFPAKATGDDTTSPALAVSETPWEPTRDTADNSVRPTVGWMQSGELG